MKVNGIDIRTFNAKQLFADPQPPQDGVKMDWLDGELTPQELDTTQTFGSLDLTLYFRGSGRNAIIRSISSFLALFERAALINIDGYKGQYYGALQSSKTIKTIRPDRYKLEIRLNGYFIDQAIAVTFDGVAGGKIHRMGTRPCPCIVTLAAKQNLAEFNLRGFDRDILVRKLTANIPIIIDGSRGLVLEDGKNKAADVDFWAFPALKKGDTAISWSSDKVGVTVSYTPMWL